MSRVAEKPQEKACPSCGRPIPQEQEFCNPACRLAPKEPNISIKKLIERRLW